MGSALEPVTKKWLPRSFRGAPSGRTVIPHTEEGAQ
jgi:hypothetical protein